MDFIWWLSSRDSWVRGLDNAITSISSFLAAAFLCLWLRTRLLAVPTLFSGARDNLFYWF